MSTEHFPEIIRAAATSPLGILALIILLLGLLALAFFRQGSEKTRMTVWVTAFGGALLFGFAILKASPQEPELKRGAIQIAYTGYMDQCNLLLTVSIGDQSFEPQGWVARLDQVPLGTQPYRLLGTITCPYLGSCSVASEGELEFVAGRRYYLAWQETGNGQCDAMLYNS